MRVPAQQRAARPKPPAAKKNKRGAAMSDATASPLKVKKRKVQAPSDAPGEAGSPTPAVGPVTTKRKAAKKTAAPPKKAEAPTKASVAAAKKLPPKKAEPKAQVKPPEKPGKKVLTAPVKAKPGKKPGPKKAAEPSGASADAAGAETMSKRAKKVKVVVNKAKAPRGKKTKAATLSVTRQQTEKHSKKILKSKKAAALGMKRHLATAGNKKTRRKPNSSSEGESAIPAVVSAPAAPVPPPPVKEEVTATHQLQVIDGVARNAIKGGSAVAKKTKDNESSAVKGKVGGKNKKPAGKKTPKNVEEITKTERVIESEIGVGVNTAVKKGDKAPDKELCPSSGNAKAKVVVKKKLKDAEKEINTKKIVEKKTSAKASKLASKAVKKSKVPSEKVKKMQATKKKPAKKESRSSSEVSPDGVNDGDNSSTSDEFPLDLLLQRQKQVKTEDSAVVKMEGVEVKTPVELVKGESPPPAPSKSPAKLETKSETTSKKPVPKRESLKKPAAMLAKRMKVKRIRPTEVTRLAGGSGSDSEQRARRIKLFGFWSGPKRHRVASLNALAKVHCLYENESRSALMAVCTKPPSEEAAVVSPPATVTATEPPPKRTLRSGPGRQGVGKHWDQQTSSSTSSSEDSAQHSDDADTDTAREQPPPPIAVPPSYKQKQDKGLIAKKPIKRVKKPRRKEVVMDLKDMVVRKRMASLNASAILAASYSMEKPKKAQAAANKEEEPARLPPPPPPPPPPPIIVDEEKPIIRRKKMKKKYLSKQIIEEEDDTDDDVPSVIELASNNKNIATVIVNQDTDVTITGVYVNSTTHRSSTTHEGYCSIAGMQYRISSTSHTQTEATAVATETLLHAPPEHGSAVEPVTQPLKSYTPLGALSNMQPPGGPMSPLNRRHGCSSAFSAPPNVQPPPPPPPPPAPHHHHLHPPPPTQGPPDAPPPPPPPYIHGWRSHSLSDDTARGRPHFGLLERLGYYQPAGPLISAHHHHSLPKPSVLPPLEASPTPTPPTLTAASSSGTRGGDESSDNDVVITATSCSNQTFSNPSSQSQQQQPPPPTYRYPPANYALPPAPQHVHQYPYGQYPQQYYPASVQGVQYSGAPPQQHFHHSQEMCYSAPSYPPAPPYYHHKTYSTPPPVTYPRRYGPPGPPHPSQYYSSELYPQGSDQQTPSRQMVATASTSASYQPPVESYPPPPPMVDPYPPPPPPPTGYYTGYPPTPACYQHSPPARSLAFIDTTYQGCPCPMQSCPKNVHTGPLTGDGKGPESSTTAATFHQLPLPPVALALPLEPPNAMGPPSPARGSAGMHPPPSPLATAQGNNVTHYMSKQEPETAQDLSKNIGLLTIHKPPPPEPNLTVLETVSPIKSVVIVDNNIHGVLKCDIELKYQHVKVSKLDTNEQLQKTTVEFNKVDPKMEKNVKVEVGNLESEPVQPDKTVRKRKLKTENISSPKPKKRTITTVKKVPVNSKQFSNKSDNVSIKTETPVQKNSKNQPLTTANSCSSHNSKQNAKKRKSSAAIDSAENQEPEPVISKRKSVDEKVTKEPKSRPKLCPSRTQATKAKNIKPSKITSAVSDPVTSETADSNSTKESTNNTMTLKPIDNDTEKTVPISDTTSSSNRKKLTKAQLNKLPNGVVEGPPEVTKLNGVVNRKKLPMKSILSKVQSNPNCIVPVTMGKVQRRRQTDTDAMRVSHMLRSHGLQEPRPAENERMTNNSKAAAISPQFLAPPIKIKPGTLKKQTGKNGCVQSMELVLSQQLILKKGYLANQPKWSNGWSWEGEGFQAKVHLNSEETGVERLCYPAMRHSEGDIIRPRDCILLKSGPRKMDLPFVAKVAQLWENPDDGEMMVSLLWYYRPEHTDSGRRPEDMPDEIFASKHKDTNSVACIEDKCYVLTFNEYCRYRAGARRLEEGIHDRCKVVPQHDDYPRQNLQPTGRIAPDMVFFCRRVYDFRQKRILKNPG